MAVLSVQRALAYLGLPLHPPRQSGWHGEGALSFDVMMSAPDTSPAAMTIAAPIIAAGHQDFLAVRSVRPFAGGGTGGGCHCMLMSSDVIRHRPAHLFDAVHRVGVDGIEPPTAGV